MFLSDILENFIESLTEAKLENKLINVFETKPEEFKTTLKIIHEIIS